MTRSEETNLKAEISNAAGALGVPTFNNPTGGAWAGQPQKIKNSNDVLIKNARFIKYGLCVGSSDLVSVVPVVVTPDMVGRTIGVACFPEIKTLKGVEADKQHNFITRMNEAGAAAGFVRSVDDLIALFNRARTPYA